MEDNCNFPVLIFCGELRSELDNKEKIQINCKKFTFGRRPSNSVVIPCLSRYHCRVEKSDADSWIIKDRSSKGIKVNGNNVGYGKFILLSDGDIITLDKSSKYVYKFMNKDESQGSSKHIETEDTINNTDATVNAKDNVDNRKIKFDELQKHKMEQVEENMQSLYNWDDDTSETANKCKKLKNPAMSKSHNTNCTRNNVSNEKEIQITSMKSIWQTLLPTQGADLKGQNKTEGRLNPKKRQADSTGKTEIEGLKRKKLEPLPDLTIEGATSEIEVESQKQNCKEAYTPTTDSSTGITKQSKKQTVSSVKQADTLNLQKQSFGEINQKRNQFRNNLTPHTDVKDKIEALKKMVRKHNKRKLELLKEINMLKKKNEEERENRKVELQAVNLSKQKMIEQFENLIKKLEEIRIKNAQEIEEKSVIVEEIHFLQHQKFLAEQQLQNNQTLFIEQDLQAEYNKLGIENLITDHMNKVEFENINLENLVQKHKERITQLLKENDELEKKIEKERKDRKLEVQAVNLSKQVMIKELEDKIKEQEAIRLTLAQELEEKRAIAEEINILREQKHTLEQQLQICQIHLIQKDLQADCEKLNNENVINERIKIVEAESRIKIENLIKEKEAVENILNEAQANHTQALQKLRDTMSQRESELTALSAERLQQLERNHTKLNNELSQQLEEMTDQLERAQQDEQSLRTSVSYTLDCQRQSVLSDMGSLLESELECSICTEIFVDSIVLNCSHTFCHYCITMHKNSTSSMPVCPLCRAEILFECKNLTLNSFIDKMVANLNEDVKEKRDKLLEDREAEVVRMNQENAAAHRNSRPAVIIPYVPRIEVPPMNRHNAAASGIRTTGAGTSSRHRDPTIRLPFSM